MRSSLNSAVVESIIGAAIEIDSREFRRVLSHLPTGVTVITAFSADGPVGMAANSVTSVSLEPPLVLICPAKSSETWPRIAESGSFCVNVLGGQHEELARAFAAKSGDRFAGVSFVDRPTGPALNDAVAWIECVIDDEHDAGDHTIVVARVVAMEASGPLEPLVFYRGQYGSFQAPRMT